MKKYSITNCDNELVKSVSVAEELVADVTAQLSALPYVDRAKPFPGLKTQIVVELSELHEASDLEDMEEMIRSAVGDAD